MREVRRQLASREKRTAKGGCATRAKAQRAQPRSAGSGQAGMAVPQGQGSVSVGCFFASGWRQTGQFLRHMLGQAFPQLTRCNGDGNVALIDHSVEFFALLKRGEKRKRFSVGCYRSSQLVKLRRILDRPPSSDVRLRREFENSFYGFVRKTRVGLHDRASLLLQARVRAPGTAYRGKPGICWRIITEVG